MEAIQRITEDKLKNRRDPRQWKWVFRFALSHLAAQENQSALDHLATCLIQYGNPFVVYRAINEDGVCLSPDLDRLCRWLVHWDDSFEGDFKGAWKDGSAPDVASNQSSLFETLFDRRYRNSRCLASAWELIAEDSWAENIRASFLGEFPNLLTQKNASAIQFQQSFHACPQDGVEIPANIDRPFELAETPTTNRQFELFDPSHGFLRHQYSQEDDQPCVLVSWFMADLFCRWLGRRKDGWGYRLPKEAEWGVRLPGGNAGGMGFLVSG